MFAVGSVQHGACVCLAAAPWWGGLLSRTAPAAHAAVYASGRPTHAAGPAAASRPQLSMTGSVRWSSSTEGPLRGAPPSSLAGGRSAHSATSSAGPQLATGYHSEAAAAVEQHHHTRPRHTTPQPQHHPSSFHRPHATPQRATWVPSSMAVVQARHQEPASSTSGTAEDKGVTSFITSQISQATMIGQLRRLLLRYKAQMEPEHIAVMLDALANVLQQHYPYPTEPLPCPTTSATAAGAATAAPVVRAKWVPPPVPPPAEQLVLAMLGDLGSLTWYALKAGDMAAEDIATVLYAWARMRWHPEPGLLAAAEAALLHSSCLDTLPPWALARAVRGVGYHKYLTPPVLVQLVPPLQAALPHCSLQQLGDIAAGLAAAHAGGVPKGMAPPAAAAVRDQQQAAIQALQVPLLQAVLHQLLLELQRHVQQQHQQTPSAAAGTPGEGAGDAPAPAPAAEEASGAAGASTSTSSTPLVRRAWGAVDHVLRALVAARVPVTPQQLQALQQLLSAAYQQQQGANCSSGLQGDAAVLLARLAVADQA